MLKYSPQAEQNQSLCHLHGADVELSLIPRPRLGQALHSLEDPVHSVLRGYLLRLQILQPLLQIFDRPPQPVPPGTQYLQVLSHLNIMSHYLIIVCTVVVFFLVVYSVFQSIIRS